MKAYLVAIVRAISRFVPNGPATRMFMSRHRAFMFVMASALLVVTTTAFLASKHYVAGNSVVNSQATSMSEADKKRVVPGADISTHITNIMPRKGGPMQTNVMVNGEQIEVPKSGTVQKTIRANNGNMTNVHISVEGNSTSSSISSSSSSVQVTTPNDTYSQSNNQ